MNLKEAFQMQKILSACWRRLPHIWTIRTTS